MKAVNVARGDLGAMYASLDTLTFDASYPTGGYAVVGEVGLQTILAMTQIGGNAASVGLTFEYIPNATAATGNLLVSVPGGSGLAGVQIAANSSLLSTSVTATFLSLGY